MKKGTLFAASTLAAAALILPAPAFAGGQFDDGQWKGHGAYGGGHGHGGSHGNSKIEKELEEFKIDNDHVQIYWSLPDAWDGVTEEDEEFNRLLDGWIEGQDGESIWPQSYDPEQKECGGVWQWDIYKINGHDNVKRDLIAAIKSGELNSGQVQEVQWGEHAVDGKGWGFEVQPECDNEEVPEEEEETPEPEPEPDPTPEEPESTPEGEEEPEAPEEEADEEEVVDEEAEEEEAEEEEETAVEVTSNEVKTPETATEELPQTGSETTSATLIGAALIALGGGAYATSRMLRARGNTVKLRHQR